MHVAVDWRASLAVLLIATAVLLAGCSMSQGSAAAGPPQPSQAMKAIPLEWQVDSVEGSTLTITTLGGACASVPPSVKVEESQSSVTINVFEESSPTPCQAVGSLQTQTVHLEEPLGTRTLSGCDPIHPSASVDCRVFRP